MNDSISLAQAFVRTYGIKHNIRIDPMNPLRGYIWINNMRVKWDIHANSRRARVNGRIVRLSSKDPVGELYKYACEVAGLEDMLPIGADLPTNKQILVIWEDHGDTELYVIPGNDHFVPSLLRAHGKLLGSDLSLSDQQSLASIDHFIHSSGARFRVASDVPPHLVGDVTIVRTGQL